jgi:hypothetical protein
MVMVLQNNRCDYKWSGACASTSFIYASNGGNSCSY